MNLKTSTLKQISEDSLPELLLVVGDLKNFKKSSAPKSLPESIQQKIEKRLKRLPEELKEGVSHVVPAIEAKEPELLFSALPKKRESFDLLTYFKGILKKTIHPKLKSIGLVIYETTDEPNLARTFGAALAAREFLIPVYGKKKKEQKALSLNDAIVYSSKNQQKKLSEGYEAGVGTNLVRELGQLPPNELTSTQYGARIKKFAKDYKLTLKVYTKAQLKKMGAGAFTAVDQGDPDSGGAIYELTYSPRGAKNKKWINLVGKGLCFDTGGYDVKTGGHMKGMKGDMQGSAVALSSLLTAVRLKLPLKIKCFLGVTENHISPKAYKVDDVITALNGISIEVINTDAEGRMVLADTLALASKAKPALMIDYATLTGCATIAIGTKYSAGFTNNDDLHDPILDAGFESGEQVWTFPLDEMYADQLKSTHADILQCVPGRSPDHINAAYFLSKFVEKGIDWVHIDLSASENKGGLAHTDTEFTGFGVLWTIQFLKNKFRV